MMIKIDDYQIDRMDKYNLKITKNVITKNDTVRKEFVGYYPTLKRAILSIIKHKSEENMDYTSLEDFIDSYNRISRDILDRLEEIL